MQISPNPLNATISMTVSDPSANTGPPPIRRAVSGEGPTSHPAAVEQLGKSLSDDIKDEILAKAHELKDSGATFGELRGFIDGQLEDHGVQLPDGGSRSGRFINTFS